MRANLSRSELAIQRQMESTGVHEEAMSPRLPRITAKQLIRALQHDGWEIERQEGSHVQLWHPSKQGLVTVAYHPSAIIKLKTLTTVLKQAGWTADDLRRLL